MLYNEYKTNGFSKLTINEIVNIISRSKIFHLEKYNFGNFFISKNEKIKWRRERNSMSSR